MDRHSLSTSSFKEVSLFILKLILMGLFVTGFLLKVSPQYLGNYQAGLIDKVNRLESLEEPKIVLLSNSNVAFGINSEEIGKAFGMPVVNMGLHGGLGNAFHERMARFHVQEGDIYIICHSNYDGDEINDPVLAWITIEDHFKLWKILRGKDLKPMFQTYPAYLKKCISLWLSGSGNQDQGSIYSRSAFNECGDIEMEDHGLVYEFQKGDITVPVISDVTAKRLNALCADLNGKGALLLLAGYPIADTHDRPADEEYTAFGIELEKKVDAPVISDYLDYIYPADYFLDTPLHLNSEGKVIRTKQLIKDLKNYLNKESSDLCGSN